MQLFASGLLIDHTKLQEDIHDCLSQVNEKKIETETTLIDNDYAVEIQISPEEVSSCLNNIKNVPSYMQLFYTIKLPKKIYKDSELLHELCQETELKDARRRNYNQNMMSESFKSLNGYHFESGTIKQVCRICLCLIIDPDYSSFLVPYYIDYKEPNSPLCRKIHTVLPDVNLRHYLQNAICSNCYTLITRSCKVIQHIQEIEDHPLSCMLLF